MAILIKASMVHSSERISTCKCFDFEVGSWFVVHFSYGGACELTGIAVIMVIAIGIDLFPCLKYCVGCEIGSFSIWICQDLGSEADVFCSTLLTISK